MSQLDLVFKLYRAIQVSARDLALWYYRLALCAQGPPRNLRLGCSMCDEAMIMATIRYLAYAFLPASNQRKLFYSGSYP